MTGDGLRVLVRFDLPDFHRADLKPRDLRYGVEGVVREEIDSRFPKMEGHEDEAGLQVIDDPGARFDAAAARLYRDHGAVFVDAEPPRILGADIHRG